MHPVGLETYNLRFRRPLLYPIELRVLADRPRRIALAAADLTTALLLGRIEKSPRARLVDARRFFPITRLALAGRRAVRRGRCRRSACIGSFTSFVAAKGVLMNPSAERHPMPACRGTEQAASSICPTCAARFRCGVEAGDSDCWCFHRPPTKSVEGAPLGQCVCPDCLDSATKKATAAQQTNSVDLS